jgi:hypothetical protein
MRWSEQRRRVSAYAGDTASARPVERSLRLSSRFTWLWRSVHQGSVLALVWMLLWPEILSPDLRWTIDRVVAYVALVLLGLLGMWVFDFVDVRLEQDEVVVSQLFRSRRFPAVLITSVSERTFSSAGALWGITIVGVVLGERVPGVGRRFRFVPRSSSVPDAAGVLRDASLQPYPRQSA